MNVNNMPLVSVVIPTYNGMEFLPHAVNSVLEQDYPNLELIIVNDGSIDETAAYLSGFKDRRVIRIWQPNQGEQVAVNTGLKAVRGKYFIILNSDDILLAGVITSLFNIMEVCPKVLCAYPDWVTINEQGKARRWVKTREWDFAWMIAHHNCIPSVGSMFRSSLIKQIGFRDTSYRWLGDFDYWFRVGLAGDMKRVPRYLACWRTRDGQASGAKSDARADEHVRIVKTLYQNKNLPPALVAVAPQAKCWSHIVAASVAKSKWRVMKEICLAVSAYPFMLVNIGFWDAFYRRALYILRR